MKRSHIWLIIAILLVVFGAVLFAIAGFSLNWNFKTMFGGKYKTVTTEVSEDFDGIYVNTDTIDIYFASSEDGKCRVVAHDREKVSYSASADNGKLLINLVDGRKWYERIFNMSFGNELTLYLPKAVYNELVIKESTGNIEIPSDFQFNSIDVKLSTGDVNLSASATEKIIVSGSTGKISLNNISAGSLKISVSTGDTIIDKLHCSGETEFKCSTGRLTLKDSSVGSLFAVGTTGSILFENLRIDSGVSVKRDTGSVKMSSVECGTDIYIELSTGRTELSDLKCKNLKTKGDTGNVKMVNVIAEGKFDIERSTGDVSFDGCDAGEIFVETDTGDVKGTLLSDKVYITETDTGRIDVPKTTTGGRCEITTDTGNIIISVK